MALRQVRARYEDGVLKPLEELRLQDRQEVLITLQDTPASRDPEAMRAAIGAWAHREDGEDLIRLLYEARISGSRTPPTP